MNSLRRKKCCGKVSSAGTLKSLMHEKLYSSELQRNLIKGTYLIVRWKCRATTN